MLPWGISHRIIRHIRCIHPKYTYACNIEHTFMKYRLIYLHKFVNANNLTTYTPYTPNLITIVNIPLINIKNVYIFLICIFVLYVFIERFICLPQKKTLRIYRLYIMFIRRFKVKEHVLLFKFFHILMYFPIIK